MLAHRIISDIVCDEYERSYGRNRSKLDKPTGMLITFFLATDYEVEDGYRHMQLFIYAEMNYVSVFVREHWDVISVDDFDYKGGEQRLKKDTGGRVLGHSAWRLASCHDSCWRQDGVESVLDHYTNQIRGIDTRFSKWQVEKTCEGLGVPSNGRDAPRWRDNKDIGFVFETAAK